MSINLSVAGCKKTTTLNFSNARFVLIMEVMGISNVEAHGELAGSKLSHAHAQLAMYVARPKELVNFTSEDHVERNFTSCGISHEYLERRCNEVLLLLSQAILDQRQVHWW